MQPFHIFYKFDRRHVRLAQGAKDDVNNYEVIHPHEDEEHGGIHSQVAGGRCQDVHGGYFGHNAQPEEELETRFA